MKSPEEIEKLCKKLKPVMGKDAEKLWYLYLSEDEDGRKDIALDIELLAEKLLKGQPLEKDKILLGPPPQGDSQGAFCVGDTLYNGKPCHPVFLKKADFARQIGIFAMTGEGKTNLSFLLATQLLKADIPFLVIDWKRSWRSLLSLKDQIPGLRDIKVFTIGRDTFPFHWNPFRAPPGADQELWVGSIAEALERSHLSGPGVAYHFNTIFSKLFQSAGEDFFPNFFDGLKEIENKKASMSASGDLKVY